MYSRIFVPVDNSEYSNAAGDLAISLARACGSRIIGSHVYAARMHDVRFKQMEFTLPEEYRGENELERQRKIHDSLITIGLGLISDSYLDVLKNKAFEAGIPFESKMSEGKNWEVLVKDISENHYDLAIMGGLGLGAVRESMIGSVTERVVRRVRVDTLVVRHTAQFEQTPGAIVAAIDGSPHSFGGLKSALRLGKILNRKVEAVGVYDPYLHYSMFNSIVGVLSEKAARVFKFKEQEKLHEEIIDTGLAKIYQSHLEIARAIAEEEGTDLRITLLDGKAYEKLLQFVRKEKPWMIVMGRIGYHSGEAMDIGSNTENLLRLAPCNILVSSRTFVPPIGIRAEAGVEWTEEAEKKMVRVPEFVRGLARSAILRYAMERGHSVISSSVVDEAVGHIMPQRNSRALESAAAVVALEKLDIYVCKQCGYAAKEACPVQCPVCKSGSEMFEKLDKDLLIEKIEKEGEIKEEESFDGNRIRWTREAWLEIERIPSGHLRRRAKARIEKTARVRKIEIITRDMAALAAEAPEWKESGKSKLREIEEKAAETGKFSPDFALDLTRNLAEERAKSEGEEKIDADYIERLGVGIGYGHPASALTYEQKFTWTPEAEKRLEQVPEFCRELTRWRVEWTAIKNDLGNVITPEIMETKYAMWGEVSERIQDKGPRGGKTMPWTEEAEKRIEKVPAFVRGMVIKTIEGNARLLNCPEVNSEVLDHVVEKWVKTGDFHEGKFGFKI